ncbi:MAG TPA: tetratricopeptide repeat protein [Gaiellaceae bacterium]|nr:tetratricopeptide repeat protein [Gaiellaceae bacterium]
MDTSVEGGATTLGERVRQLRIEAGLTQTDLAGGRFSKEYVSQIERGKTRPTRETLEWLAGRLGVDAGYLDSGVSTEQRGELEARLARAEAFTEGHRYDEALTEFEAARASFAGYVSPELELRTLLGESWAHIQAGTIQTALDLLARARELAEQTSFTDVDRAAVLFRLGVCRYKLSSISTAIGLFDAALELADRSTLPCDLLRADILGWRSRCYRRQRDWQAAREDVERALELAEAMSDPRAAAQVHFQASLVAEREGRWGLARTHAERARYCYEQLEDRANVGRLLNNLGAFTFLLGDPAKAIELLNASFALAVEAGDEPEAGHVTCSLAEVHLATGDAAQAEIDARKALELFGGRVDYLQGIGTAQLRLGRALLEQGRLNEAEEILLAADKSFEQLSSVSHRAAAWVALGDLAGKRGADAEAARHYRRAAEALQDFRF